MSARTKLRREQELAALARGDAGAEARRAAQVKRRRIAKRATEKAKAAAYREAEECVVGLTEELAALEAETSAQPDLWLAPFFLLMKTLTGKLNPHPLVLQL